METFKIKAQKRHGGKYKYIGEYKNAHTKIEIVCPEHGSFWQTPGNHLHNNGCSNCAKHGFNFLKPAILYYFQDIESGLYKSGVTNDYNIRRRFAGKIKNRIRLISIEYFINGKEAYTKEQLILKKFKEFRCTNIAFAKIGGKKEFFIKDILNNDTKLLPYIKEKN